MVGAIPVAGKHDGTEKPDPAPGPQSDPESALDLSNNCRLQLGPTTSATPGPYGDVGVSSAGY